MHPAWTEELATQHAAHLQATASTLGETPGPAAGHRHTVPTVTTPHKPAEHRGHRGYFGSRGAPAGTR
jgi:hypothetical protein